MPGNKPGAFGVPCRIGAQLIGLLPAAMVRNEILPDSPRLYMYARGVALGLGNKSEHSDET